MKKHIFKLLVLGLLFVILAMSSGCNDSAKDYEAGYQAGLLDGHLDGYKEGTDYGRSAGQDLGFCIGYEYGYSDGCHHGANWGYEIGWDFCYYGYPSRPWGDGDASYLCYDNEFYDPIAPWGGHTGYECP